MTCQYQTCRGCPHRPKSDLNAAPFDADLAMRSMEFVAARLGMHWNCQNTELDIAIIPDITEILPLHTCETETGRCGCRPENNDGLGICGKTIAPIIVGS